MNVRTTETILSDLPNTIFLSIPFSPSKPMAEFSDPNRVVPFSFSDLPEDVQLCILSFLSPSDISTFACTSKRFVHLCGNDNDKLWFSICDRKWGSKTQINKWVNTSKITYKHVHKILIHYESLIGFWRRTGQPNSTGSNSAPLVFFEWGPSFVSGSTVSPSKTGTYRVTKAPFLWLSIGPEGEPLNFLYPECKLESSHDLIPVNVSFVGNNHVVVEDSLRQRKSEKERPPEHFVKVVDCSPTLSRPLQGLWKGIGNDMNLNFYVVEYDDIGGISCRRIWDASKPFSDSFPVFWTPETEFMEFPNSPEEEYSYYKRVHLHPLASADGVRSQSWTGNETVSRILYINSSFDMMIRDLVGISGNTQHVQGMIWLYEDGTFGYGFLRDNYIIHLNHVARNGCLLDTVELNGCLLDTVELNSD
ncbi:F-box protein At3g12350-like [Cornus florida]|uniref:F-box protein At3g12350-like n=1 Tax=Cornus florida TaxID=4283 RepID=UPI002897CC5D|nr:F-box protein At3g12350-like [Cornus florida]